jgi:hypothetical protein
MGFYEIFWVLIGLEDERKKIKGNVTVRLKEVFYAGGAHICQQDTKRSPKRLL